MNTLYLITHRISGKCYVGWTSKPIEKYWNKHISEAKRIINKSGQKRYFHNALNKYGREAFVWEVISLFDTIEEAKWEEIYWIDRLKNFNVILYNETNGGEGIVGIKRGLKSVQKQIDYMNRPEIKEEISKRFKGVPKSEEAKRKMSIAKSGRIVSEETKQKLSKYFTEHPSYSTLGKHLSEETKNKISQAHIGKIIPDEVKEKISKATKGENNPRAKLTEKDVIEIRYLCENNLATKSELAKKHNVSWTTIKNILLRKLWKHLP